MSAGDLTDLLEMIQRGQEQIDVAQRQERALALQKFADYHASSTSNYQRALDEIYRAQRLMTGLGEKIDRVEERAARLEKGQEDMHLAQGQYQDEEQKERHTRQKQNDRRFRRIEWWLALVTIPVLIVTARVLWLWLGGA